MPGQMTPAFVEKRARVPRCHHARLGRGGGLWVGGSARRSQSQHSDSPRGSHRQQGESLRGPVRRHQHARVGRGPEASPSCEQMAPFPWMRARVLSLRGPIRCSSRLSHKPRATPLDFFQGRAPTSAISFRRERPVRRKSSRTADLALHLRERAARFADGLLRQPPPLTRVNSMLRQPAVSRVKCSRSAVSASGYEETKSRQNRDLSTNPAVLHPR